MIIQMKKLIIIPAYNESANIQATVENIRKTVSDFDYVVINDHSNSTLDILEQNHYNFVSLPVNLGIGGAVQTRYKYALENGYDAAVQVDADGQHDVSYLHNLVSKMEQEQADMVISFPFHYQRRLSVNIHEKSWHHLLYTDDQASNRSYNY